MAENNAMDYRSDTSNYTRSASVSYSARSTQATGSYKHSAEEAKLNEHINDAVKSAIEPFMNKLERLVDGAVKSTNKSNAENAHKFEEIDRQLQTLSANSLKITTSKKEYKQQIEMLARQKSEWEKKAEDYEKKLSMWKAEVQSQHSDPSGHSGDLISWLSSWVKTSKSDHSNIKYLQQENNGLKAKIIELENSVAQRDSTIDRLRGKKMDFLEKSEAVIDISRNENQTILEDYRKFLDLKLCHLASLLKKASKEYSLLNHEELQKSYQYFGNNPEQSFIQVELTRTLQKCYDVAISYITAATVKQFEQCKQNSKHKTSRGNEDDDEEYIFQVEDYTRRQHRTNKASSAMVITMFRNLINLIFNPMTLQSKPLNVPTRQFLSRFVQQFPQQDAIKCQEMIKNEFMKIVGTTKLQPMVQIYQAKTTETASEAAKIIWKLVTASPPIILCSETKTPYNTDLHVLCSSGYVSFAKSKLIKEEDESNMPHVQAYATPIVFRNNDGHVAFKAQVFI